MKIKYLIPILLVMLVFGFTGCKEKVTSETTETIATTTTQTIVVETTATETTVVDMDKVKFWEAIVEGEKSYDISDKILDYPMEEINILNDFIDGKINTEEEITRFWELANKVQKDFFLAEMLIEGRLKEKGVTPDEDMENIINIIVEWADKTENSYSYYAKYLDTKQAEYDFKVDECKKEASNLYEEYLKLRSPFIKEYNTYNGIE